MSKKVMKCCGTYNKKDECGREFYYALRDEMVGSKMVTILYAVDRKGCPIKNGNLIVLPHEDPECNGILLCDDISEDFNFALEMGGTLVHDESCCSNNDYFGEDE